MEELDAKYTPYSGRVDVPAFSIRRMNYDNDGITYTEIGVAYLRVNKFGISYLVLKFEGKKLLLMPLNNKVQVNIE